MTNTKTIARNTGWFSIENIFDIASTLVASILINRYLGPDKNGYMVYISQIASMVSGLGGIGIPATTRKYMAEFIGMGDWGTARYIYLRTLALQVFLATLVTGGFFLWVLRDASADYKLASALLVLSGNGDGTFGAPVEYTQFAGAASVAIVVLPQGVAEAAFSRDYRAN